ncbi:hypothetical protein HYT84_04075 [Candidatus Micrarchaeota archaeon]|nr:hypothetical protein [Candidatus Micrarchaeota archaeon]
MDKKNLLYIGLFLLLVLSFFLAYAPYGLSEKGYADLLSKGSYLSSLDLSTIKILVILSAFISAVLVWLSVEDKNIINLSVVVLFLLSPYIINNVVNFETPGEFLPLILFSLSIFLFSKYENTNLKYIAILPIALGLYISYPYGSFDLEKIKEAGFILPLSFLVVGRFLATNTVSNELIITVLGIILSTVNTPLALVLLTFSTIRETKYLDELKNVVWFLIILLLSFYLLFNAGFSDPLNILIIGGSVILVLYLVSSLYSFNFKSFSKFFFLFLMLTGFSYIILNLDSAASTSKAPTQAEIETLLEIKAKGYSVASLSESQSFVFYTGKNPQIITSQFLLSDKKASFGYLLLSSDSLFSTFASQPIVFRFLQFDESSGSRQAVFLNSPYLLLVPISNSGAINGNAKLVVSSGENTFQVLREIPFTKLKLLDSNLQISDQNNLIIDMEGIEDSLLSNIISKYIAVYKNGNVKILKVSE